MPDLCERICPRCEGPLPVEDILCSISRHDNNTLICGNCGVDEAMLVMRGLPLIDPHQFNKESK